VANRDRGAVCYPEEAIGIVRAGERFKMPVVIAFTVETDGRLPTGMSLKEVIDNFVKFGQSWPYFFFIFGSQRFDNL